MTRTPHTLLARLDNVGDVLLTGPAVRAVRASGHRVTFLTSPRSGAAAELLPGVDTIVTFDAPWIDADPEPVEAAAMHDVVAAIERAEVDEALIFTSFHQSPLPLALLLRMAGVPTIAAISVDYPGSLLDVRHLVDDDIHEVERNLSLVGTLGHQLPAGDDGRLLVTPRSAAGLAPGYVVVHPGASVPARSLPPDLGGPIVDTLVASGHRVVVTGGPGESDGVAADRHAVTDLTGATDLAGLAGVLAGAAAVVTGNTGPSPPGRRGRHAGGRDLRAHRSQFALAAMARPARAAG